MEPEEMGKWFAISIFALLALIVLVRVVQAQPRSLRLANLSILCGLLMFLGLEYALGLNPVEHPTICRGSGTTRVLIGLAGILACILALVARKKDQGTGVARPVVGGVFSLVHALGGASLLLMPFLIGASSSDPWTYRSAQHGIQITLPSSSWVEAREPDFSASFRSRRWPMHAGVQARSDVNEEQAKRMDTLFRQMCKDPKMRATDVVHEEDVTAAGDPYVFTTLKTKSEEGNRNVYFAQSQVWLKDKEFLVVVAFEGMLRMTSQTGAASELAVYEESARAICLSVSGLRPASD